MLLSRIPIFCYMVYIYMCLCIIKIGFYYSYGLRDTVKDFEVAYFSNTKDIDRKKARKERKEGCRKVRDHGI